MKYKTSSAHFDIEFNDLPDIAFEKAWEEGRYKDFYMSEVIHSIHRDGAKVDPSSLTRMEVGEVMKAVEDGFLLGNGSNGCERMSED